MWKRALAWGLVLGLGTLALQWLDYRHMVLRHSDDLYIGLIAAAFLAGGVWIGVRVIGKPPLAKPFDGNPKAQASLGISPRELAVLHALAAGRSNKEIAVELAVSPNTVKTHVTRLYGKLTASRRTDAIKKARELGLLP